MGKGTRRGFLCPATLLPMLMLALSINQMIRPLEAARQSDDYADIEDNDFAEFDFEDETDESLKVTDEEEDMVKRYKLPREAKNKADKNRTKVAENHWRSIHAVKAEKAAEERERKKRELKERIREIEDPEKQRKMEERENKREKKKAQPKMKQLKVN